MNPTAVWPRRTLADLGGKVTSGSRGWAVHYSDHGSLFVRITNLTRESIRLDLTNPRFVDVDGQNAEAQRTRLAPGDLLVSITADIGIIGYVDGNVPSPAYINQHIARVRIDPRLADSRFVAYYLASWGPQRSFVGVTDQGAKAGMNLTAVASLSTAVPPLAEQHQIAGALADVDDLIAALERQIAKQQALKAGMVQQLLTGRMRLPGFSHDWSSRTLGSIAELRKGAGLSKSDLIPAGRDLCIHYGELFTHYGPEIENVTSRTNAVGRVVRSEESDVLMPTSDVTPRGLAKASAIHKPGVVIGGDVLIIRPDKSEAHGPFIAHAIRNDANQVLKLVRGSTVFHLYGSDMKNFRLGLPQVDEQRAIAQVLHDSLREIEAVSARLAKARAIKAGMMQELLTGRSRLPVEASS